MEKIENASADQKTKVFVISPIGADKSPIRQNADRFLDYIVRAALPEDEGYRVRRADDDDSPYAITEAMLREILEADICIADITGRNPNVMYELALAHAAAKKVVIMTSDSDGLPFDIKDMRAIRYGLMPEEVAAAIAQLRQKATHEPDSEAFHQMLNPVATAFKAWMDVQKIETQSGSADQALARVIEKFEGKLDRALGSRSDGPAASEYSERQAFRQDTNSMMLTAERLAFALGVWMGHGMLPERFELVKLAGQRFLYDAQHSGDDTELRRWVHHTELDVNDVRSKYSFPTQGELALTELLKGDAWNPSLMH